jgi:AcrR family transcriptional regulator
VAGLRERKKAATRALIAACAARLFAVSGFRAVSMAEVALAAEVSEQTVYNHFPTKESLVFDRAPALLTALLDLAGQEADLIGFEEWLKGCVLGESARRAISNPGGMPRLVASDGGLRRHLLGLAGEWAEALAGAWAGSSRMDPVVARTLADAALQVFVRAVDRLGVIETEREAEREAERVIESLEADISLALKVLRPAFGAISRQD